MSTRAERRQADRKSVDSIQVSDMTSLSNYRVIAKKGVIIDASTSGFLVQIDRKDLVPAELKSNLNLDSLVGQQIVLFLPQMNLDLDGTVNRTSHKGRGHFQIAIEFSRDVPEYWRECLIDLLPAPGEMAAEEKKAK
ncbi:MAG: hypothetical protein IT288_07565 [Bdellovibrionales bacterium]|nr:hypothetical protein [Bdellovibrionales bacterium]